MGTTIAVRYSPTMRRIERLINLIIALLEAPRPLTADDIREQIAGYDEPATFEAFRRAFERDKEALRNMGIPLEVVPTDPFVDQADGYTISKARYYLPQLDLEPDEIAALRLAAESVLGAADEAESGYLKVAIDANITPTGAPRVVWGADLAAEQPRLGPIYQALLDRTPVAFEYQSASGESRRRTLEPYGLVHRKGNWYVVGRDRGREDIRSFKVTRIASELERLPATYDVPPGFEASEHLAGEAWEMGRGDEAAAALIRFDPRLRWWAEQNLQHLPLREVAGGAVEVETPLSNIDALVSWVLDFGTGVEIVAPEQARDALLQHLRPYLDVGPAAG